MTAIRDICGRCRAVLRSFGIEITSQRRDVLFRLSNFHPRVLLWRAVTNIGPLPVMARARSAATWQDFWRTEDSDAVFRDYAKGSPLRDWLAGKCAALGADSVLEMGCNVGANLQAFWRADK